MLEKFATHELYGELMRRGESWQQQWALHVVALSRTMRLLQICIETDGLLASATEEFETIRTMLGDTFTNGLVREAERIVDLEVT